MTNINTNQRIIDSLKLIIDETITPLFDSEKPYALLDFPNHSNVGDSAIWLGESLYFKVNGKCQPSYVSSIGNNFSQQALLSRVPEGGTIFIHGGGNFGDIWPKMQDFKEMILSSFGKHKIIQLPQSIYFGSESNVEKSKLVINQHPDFTLLVRDRNSYDFASKHYSCNVILCPDMAFYIGSLQRPQHHKVDTYFLKRSDKEKCEWDSNALGNLNGTILEEDWLEENDYKKEKLIAKLSYPLRARMKLFDKQTQRYHLFNAIANARFNRGLKSLSLGKTVLTDRLHAYILSTLLGIPVVYLDNNYGKISNFANEWMQDHRNAWKAHDLSEAVSILNDISV